MRIFKIEAAKGGSLLVACEGKIESKLRLTKPCLVHPVGLLGLTQTGEQLEVLPYLLKVIVHPQQPRMKLGGALFDGAASIVYAVPVQCQSRGGGRRP